VLRRNQKQCGAGHGSSLQAAPTPQSRRTCGKRRAAACIGRLSGNLKKYNVKVSARRALKTPDGGVPAAALHMRSVAIATAGA
jgi:hypothetical protein